MTSPSALGISDPPETPAETPDNPQVIPDYGHNNRDLPQQIVDLFKSTISEYQGQEKFARRREIRADRKLRFYEAGQQHLQYWGSSGGFSLLSAGGAVYNNSGGSINCPAYMDSYNIFLRFFLIVQAVLTQQVPSVRWMPSDPDQPDDIDKTKEGENYSKLWDRHNDPKDIQGQVVRMLGMSGRTVAWTRSETDAQKFGLDEDGNPRSFERTSIYGTLETRCPIACKELNEKTGFFIIYEDSDIDFLRDRYDWIADKIKAGQAALGENDYERYARLGVLCGARGSFQVGDSLSHLGTEGHYFLRPFTYSGKKWEVAVDGAEGETAETAKELALRLFPEGVRCVFVGDTFAEAHAESMDDHLAVIWPYQGDSMFRQGFMEVMAIVSDNFNDLANWVREKVDTGAGETYAAGDEDEIDAITNRRAAPNAIVPAKGLKTPNEPLANAFYKTPDPAIPASLFQLLELMRGELPEFLLAALPSIQGADDTGNKTASGYAMASANAKGQLGILWARMQRMWARIRYQAALCAANSEQSGVVKSPAAKDGDDAVAVNYDALKKGNFGCYPDEDSGFPETTSQKRMILKDWVQLAGQSPVMAELLDNPDNIEQMKELNGFSELVFIAAEARTKQMFEIKQMLSEAPIPADPELVAHMQEHHAAASIAGPGMPPFAPPQPTPSVPIQELDFHQYEFQKCQEWLSSKARRDEEKKGNQQGIQNIILHALAHQQKLQAAMAAAMPPPPPPGGKGIPSPPSEKKETPGTRVPEGA